VAAARGTLVRFGVPVALALLAGLGVWLIAAGGDEGEEANTDSVPREQLDIQDTDQESIADLAGLSLPEDTEDFLTARLDDDTQLDVTFTLDPAEEADFLTGSGLGQPVEDQRVVFHSSPLWKLNPETDVRGSENTAGGLRRQVELVAEDDRTRVRLVVTPAGN
jgi:hypothetical protein